MSDNVRNIEEYRADVLDKLNQTYETADLRNFERWRLKVLEGLANIYEAEYYEPKIIEAVDNWLDEHPEATTTVADGSITKAKLYADLIAEIEGKADETDVNELKSDLILKTEPNQYEWEVGGINGSTGQNVTNQDFRGRTVNIEYASNDTTLILLGTKYRFAVLTYDENDNFVADGSWIYNKQTIKKGTYFRIIIAKATEDYVPANFDLAEAVSKLTVRWGFLNVVDELEPTLEYYKDSSNLFDKSAVTTGWITTNSGAINTDSNFFTSDYIPIEIGKSYTFPVAKSHYGETAGKRVPIFDTSKTNIGYINGTFSDNILTVTISLSAVGSTVTSNDMKYLRFSNFANALDVTMAVEGAVYPSTYEPYGMKWLADSFGLNKTQKDEVGKIAGASVLAGKLIAYNGDSIAESRIAAGNTYNGGAYAKMIADLTSGTYENRSHSGGILASAVGDGGSMPHSVVNDVANMTNDADLICFEGGINDYWRHVPLGDYSESDYSSTLDTTTICGALESIFRQAKQKWVGKPICFVITHKIKSTVYIANSAGYTWMQVHEKIVGICKKYAIPYYDAFTESGLNAYDDIQNTTFLTSNSSGTADGCHPNALGYEKYYVPQLIALFEKIMPRD